MAYALIAMLWSASTRGVSYVICRIAVLVPEDSGKEFSNSFPNLRIEFRVHFCFGGERVENARYGANSQISSFLCFLVVTFMASVTRLRKTFVRQCSEYSLLKLQCTK